MKTFFKLSLVILSISLVNCKKDHDEYYELELKNEYAIVRLNTDLPDNFIFSGFEVDELFYLELVNPHPKLPTKYLYIVPDKSGTELFEPYQTEGLSIIIGGYTIVEKDPSQCPNVPRSFNHIVLTSIEATE